MKEFWYYHGMEVGDISSELYLQSWEQLSDQSFWYPRAVRSNQNHECNVLKEGTGSRTAPNGPPKEIKIALERPAGPFYMEGASLNTSLCIFILDITTLILCSTFMVEPYSNPLLRYRNTPLHLSRIRYIRQEPRTSRTPSWRLSYFCGWHIVPLSHC
jgi:hypothetical protein